MKAVITFLFSFAFLSGAFAQNFTLSGTVVDEQGKPMIGTNVALIKAGEVIHGSSTDAEGRFLVEGLAPRRYLLEVSFIGFETIRKPIKIVDQNLDLGQLQMKAGGVDLTEVEVVEKTVMAQQEGDTTVYNAKAFKTMPDASAEELVEKMPGVVIQDGQVQAQGENVQEVLVDGRPFFGNDPTAALRNLPAEVVDRIQIFDQRSDQSNFTGFDDGNTTKTINIITKPNFRAGQFGKLYAGYGTEERYKAGGNFSIFNGDQRISIIAQSNNINEQNFSTEDLLGVVSSGGGRRRGGFGGGRGGGRGGRGGRGGGSSVNDFLIAQQGGIASTQALGINYSDKWGEKMDVSGSYFFNLSNNRSVELLNQQFFDAEDDLDTFGESYTENSDSETDNLNHRLNFRLEYQIDSVNSLIMRPRLSWQDNDGIATTFAQNLLEGNFTSETNNVFTSALQGVNFSNNLLWRHRFAKRRRTFSINLSSGYNSKKGESLLDSRSDYFNGRLTTEELDQLSELDNDGWNLGTSFNYTEPIGRRSMLMLNYRYNQQRENADRITSDYDEAAQDYSLQNDLLSNVFTNAYTTNQIGAGYNYRKGRSFLMARANFQVAELDNAQTFPQENTIERRFYNVLPMIMYRNRLSRSNNFFAFYRTSTSSPSVTQLQNVVDNSNPLQLSVGNPNLLQSFQHRVMARYQKANTEKSTVFFALLSANVTQNHIGNATYLADSDHPIFA
ncbi:MAG: carboxypeptidase regulatory-like domain-containing protein [Bacteroidota bacterium]